MELISLGSQKNVGDCSEHFKIKGMDLKGVIIQQGGISSDVFFIVGCTFIWPSNGISHVPKDKK
jgi:hypothetical protein